MEFFGKAVNANKAMSKNADDKEMHDDLYWYIVDHDKLHKDFFHPLAKKIKHAHKSGKIDKETLVKEFMPMVNKGCMEYYKEKKMKGNLDKAVSREVREEMCERLYDHYCDDIVKDTYKLGN
jgi:hypothetical protein